MEIWKQASQEFDNPVELALTRTSAISNEPDLESTREEKQALCELDSISESLGFHRKYFVESRKAFAIPVSFERDEEVSYIRFDGLTFWGKLETFSTVKIGRLAIVDLNIRALCLTFNLCLLLPFFDTLAEDKLLFVPAAAISDIQSGSWTE